MAIERLVTVYGTNVMVCTPDGAPLDTEAAATELIGEAITQRAEVVVIPTERLTDAFFELKTRVAGEIAQKFVTYRIRLAIVGDIAHRTADSVSLGGWVAESNSGQHLWFCSSFDEFKQRLDRRAPSSA